MNTSNALATASGLGASRPKVACCFGYRFVATSVAGFVQQLAVAYVAHGYWFYVTGRVSESKDPSTVDRKIIRQYGIHVSKRARSRRKKTG